MYDAVLKKKKQQSRLIFKRRRCRIQLWLLRLSSRTPKSNDFKQYQSFRSKKKKTILSFCMNWCKVYFRRTEIFWSWKQLEFTMSAGNIFFFIPLVWLFWMVEYCYRINMRTTKIIKDPKIHIPSPLGTVKLLIPKEKPLSQFWNRPPIDFLDFDLYGYSFEMVNQSYLFYQWNSFTFLLIW